MARGPVVDELSKRWLRGELTGEQYFAAVAWDQIGDCNDVMPSDSVTRLFCNRQKGHDGPHAFVAAVWPMSGDAS